MTTILEATPRNCFSREYLLTLDGRPVGHITTRFLNEGIDIRFTEHRRFRLEHRGFFTGRFELLNDSGEVIGGAKPAGFFSSTWDLMTSVGPARLKRGWFGESPVIVDEVGEVAWVSRRGSCKRGWIVRGEEGLELTDLLLVGLAHHTIEQREASAAAAST